MGFFDLTDERINTNQPPVELLHKQGCALCTLDREARNLANPKMAATGSKTPLIYILGEAPGADEDKQGEQFVGASGSYLRDRIPLKFNDHIRFNNALNCRPPGNRDPTSLEIECCRPRILEDIETTQPEAIFAMGGFALHWAGIPNGITAWRGRRLPVRIGRHVCWLFPMVHPAYLLHLRSQNRNSQPSNFEMAFDFDIRRAFREVAAGLPEPVVHTEQIAKRNIECFTGKFHNELGKIADFLEEAATRERAGVDYETQNLRPYHRDSAILTTAVALPERAIAFAVDHPEAGWTDRDKRHLTELWTRFLCSPVAKTAHHAHFEQEWSAYFYGPEVVRASRWDCTLTQAYILDERRDGLSLEFLCQQHFGINIKQITGTLNKNNMKSEPLAKLLPYNGIDSKYHLHLFDAQAAELQRQKLTAPYEEKLRQVPTCVMTMLKGMPVDGEINKQFTVKYDQLLKEAETAIMALPEIAEFRQCKGVEFKPGSDKDILFLLREILHKEVPNTDKTVMEALDHPFGKMELAWRNASKMRSTYIEPFSVGRAYPDGLMHPYFGTCFTDTGRLNCLHGDTPVYVLDSRGSVKIKDIKSGDWVWSFDDSLKPVAKQVSWSGKTKTVSKLVEVCFLTQGNREVKSVRCTPDHPFRRRNGRYIEASELREGDRLLSIERTDVVVGNDTYRRMYYTGQKQEVKEHMAVLGLFSGTGGKGGNHIHHVDENGLNNIPTNLEILTPAQHRIKHPWSEESRARVGKSIREAYSSGRIVPQDLRGSQNPNYKAISREECLRILYENGGKPTAFRDEYGWDYDTISKKLKEHGIDWREIKNELRASDNNHVVVSVRNLDEVCDVYDISVPDTHNFIANGVNVHNSSDPNAQNLPKRDEDNREVRRQIAPPNGGIFLAADYGQIEARLIAAGSQDPVYCKATWDGYDVHGYWAGRIAKRCPDVLLPWSNLPEKEQMAKLRDKVKNRFVFPSFFSAQLGSVCHYMGIDENTLKPEYDQFWRDFAGIKSFQDKTLSDFQQQGYVACFNGRRRRAPLGLGQVINAAIQGSAADVVMDGMNRLSEMGRPEIQPMIMIHDDLTFWFHSERELEDNVDVVVHEMLNVRFDWLCVPLTVELSIGTNLCDMQKIGTVASDKLLGWPERPVFAQ